MPPGASQKGTGKKGGSGAMRQQPRSRNTTPSAALPSATASLPPIEVEETETLELKFELFRNVTYEDLVDLGSSNAVIPDSKSLDGIVTRLQRLGEIIEKRGSFFDRGMRLLAANRRTRMDEIAERGRDEERRTREVDEEERERKANKKKRKATENLAPQDSNIERSSPLRESGGKPRKQSRDNDSASSSLSPVEPRTPTNMEVDEKTKTESKEEDESSSDEDDGRPPPPARPNPNTFGEDPSTFPDPTVYEILPVQPGMTEDEIKEIYSVGGYPHSDLADLIAGDPPDKDFSSAKPSNQINFSTFSTYIEPYFRPFTEEDLAFLRERGDRVTPFVMPKRGKKHYTDVWAEEDGAMSIDSSPQGRDKLAPNQARGNIENMDDDIAETDKLSVGPLLSRLLSAMRPEHRAPAAEDKDKQNSLLNSIDLNGDLSMSGSDFNFNFNDTPASSSQPATNGTTVNGVNGVNGTGAPGESSLPAATFMPESNTEAWKKVVSHPKLDYQQVDERLKQELRHIGFLPPLPTDPATAPATDPNQTADYDGHFDDEVAARLRLLQARLREQTLVNAARKSRLTDLVKERMAYQEYQTILEDLDNQVNAAYLKRTRTMGKKPKKARPGAAAAAAAASAAGAGGPGGLARPGIGDLTKTLMERRRRWIENIGTVFDGENLGKVPRVEDNPPGENATSIFKQSEMATLMRREKDAWDEEVDEE